MSRDEIVVYSTTWCGDCRRARRVLDRHGANYRWIDVDTDHEAAERVIRINNGMRVVPTILFPDGTVMTEPSDDDAPGNSGTHRNDDKDDKGDKEKSGKGGD